MSARQNRDELARALCHEVAVHGGEVVEIEVTSNHRKLHYRLGDRQRFYVFAGSLSDKARGIENALSGLRREMGVKRIVEKSDRPKTRREPTPEPEPDAPALTVKPDPWEELEPMATAGITEPGVYDIPAEEYHADPTPAPSLSNSIAKLLIERSALHAWFAHPRLNPNHQSENKTDFDIGSAAHKLLLGKGAELVTVDAKNYQTNAAKEARDAAYDAGRIPLLPHHREAVDAMVAAARQQIAVLEMPRRPFTDGLPERTLIWREDYSVDGPAWCRAMMDWYSHDGAFIDDLKTTTNAEPEACKRRLFDLGYDMQAAWYRRGAQRITDRLPEFRFVFVERDPPHALSVVVLKDSDLDAANDKLDLALERWLWCLEHGKWPGYPARPVTVEAPISAHYRWADRQASEELARDATGKSLIELGIEMQKPLEMAK